MNDLDFDELDSAVSALVAKDQSNDDAEPKTVAKPTAEQAPLVKPAEPVQVARQAPVQEEQPPKPSVSPRVIIPARSARLNAKPPATPAVSRGVGRGFMDIVAPKPGIKPPARVAATVKPLVDAKKLLDEAAVDANPTQKTEASKKVEPEKKIVPQPSESSETIWPDPIDLPKDEPKKEAEASTEAEPPTNSTPFIPLAKVEKRPLGAYSNFTPEETKPEAPKVTKSTEIDAAEPNSVPPELQPDVLAVESGQLEPETKEDPKLTKNSAMMSIPQQYKSAEKPIDDSTRPIYDSKDYHPPLAGVVPPTKKSRKGLVIGIIITVILLAAVGYVAYLLMTGGLDLTKLGLGV